MFEKKAITQVPINDLIARRWSGRAYNPEKTVPSEVILRLLEAARWSPSCFGDQPWRFIICNRKKEPDAWQSAFNCLSEGNQSWASAAPVLILAIADSILSKNEKPNRWAQYDTGAAAYSLCLQATEDDLMVHQMGGFDTAQLRDNFSIPDQFTPMAVMAVGYQLPLDDIPADLKERELSGRKRNSPGEHFFAGKWGVAYNF